MMRITIAMLMLFSFNALAESEFNVSYARINQKLDFAQPIHFKMDAIQLGYTYYYYGGLGIELTVARSTETPNAFFLDKHYQNKINALWSGHFVYRHRFSDKLYGKAGIGITEYNSTWKVDGVEPEWSEGTDSHKPSWFLGLQYDWHPWLTFEAGYRFQYEKMKEGYGEEVTDSITSGFTIRF